MITFKCIYCGQRILASEDGHGKKGKCPKCKHILVIPKSTKGRPAISPNKEPLPERPEPRVPEWDKYLRSGHDEPADELIDLFKESFGFLVPTYDKLSLFLMAVTLILLYVSNIQMLSQMRDQLQGWIHYFRTESYDQLVFFIVLIFLATLTFQISTSRKETDIKKKFMLAFAVLTNAASGIIAGMYVIKNTVGLNWLIVFPVWNIINCVLLLLMLRFRIIDEDCISDRKATFVQIILGLIAVAVIFVFCNYVFKLYWAITFSICIVYTTSFDRALQNLFPGLMDRGYE